MANSYKIKLGRTGQQYIEDWWIRSGRSVPKPASRSEEIRNQVSFVNYDLQQKGFSNLRTTPVEDEFIVDQVQPSRFKEFVDIVGYHGFDVIP